MLFIVEGILSIALAGFPKGRNQEEQFSQPDIVYRKSILINSGDAKMATTVVSSTLQAALAQDLASVPQVSDILIENVKGAFLVWVVVDNPERQVRDRIFQKQMDLMDAFPEIGFDFNLIPSMGRPVNEIATGAIPVYSRTDFQNRAQ